MTYLEIVNKLLRRLREDEVTSVSDTDYSLLVGEFVNDAKRIVEDAWPWRALIDTVTIPLVSGTTSYDIEDYNCSGSGAAPRENARLYKDPQTSEALIRITTDDEETFIKVFPQSQYFVQRAADTNDTYESKPEGVILSTNPGVTSGNSNIRLFPYPYPDASYNMQVYLVNPQNDLSADSDVILVPSFPIMMTAYLYCLYERGEEVGELLNLTTAKAEAALSDAIQHDHGNTSEVIFQI